MSLPLAENQAVTLSTAAQAFLRAAPAIRLPQFLYRHLTSPSKVAGIRAQFQAGEDKVEEQLIQQHDLRLERRTLAGVPILVITPAQIAKDMLGVVVMNIHGGGFVMGTARDRTALLTAAELGAQVWSIDYALAPEARFPVAIHQCLAVYQAIVASHDARRVVGVSSSSGGQLMLAMLQLAHAAGTALPGALAMYTPASDISGAGDSVRANDGRDVVPFRMSMALMEQNYLNGADPRDPRVSPIYADYPSTFSPTVISTGTRDLLLSNSTRLYWKLRAAGVPSELLVTEGGWHGHNWEPELEEGKRMRTAVYEFLRARLAMRSN